MTIELVSFDDLKDLLTLSGAEIIDYPALALIRLRVTNAIEEHISRDLELIERTKTVFVNLIQTKMIMLKAVPVSSVSSVIISSVSDTETLTDDEYQITEYGLFLPFRNVKNVKIDVVYTGGYSSETLPQKIKDAALYQVAYEYQSKDEIGATTVSTDGGMVSRPALGLLKETKRMLQSQKHPLLWR